MKKIFSMLLILSILMTVSVALAEGMGVQVIGGPVAETEPVSLDDFKLNTSVTIDGYATITGTEYLVWDEFNYRKSEYSSGKYESGQEAEYVWLKLDILNLTTTARDYLTQYEVKVVYDDVYEYAGWAYQCDYDWNSGQGISKDYNFAIEPMYTGHYYFGCTLPNAIINSKAPLTMIINIDGNEITYNIRK